LRILTRSRRIAWKRHPGPLLGLTTGGVALHLLDLGFGGSRSLQSSQFCPAGWSSPATIYAGTSSLATRACPQSVKAWIAFSRIRSITWAMNSRNSISEFAHHRVNRCHETSCCRSLFLSGLRIQDPAPSPRGTAVRAFRGCSRRQMGIGVFAFAPLFGKRCLKVRVSTVFEGSIWVPPIDPSGCSVGEARMLIGRPSEQPLAAAAQT